MLNDYFSTVVLPIEFSCTILIDDMLVSNVYYIKLGIDPSTDALEHMGIGIQRIKYIVENYFQNSVIVNQEHELAKPLDFLDNNLISLPCEPYDFFVGAILFSKFEAITEKYIDIQYLTVASMIGDRVQYNLESPYDSGLELEGEHWWNSDNVNTGSQELVTWDALNLTESPVFRPTVVKGGLSEK